MVDKLTVKERSWNMSRIYGKDTKPEIHIRSLLHRMGFRFRLHRKDLPGRPDIVLPKYNTVVFVHGCFWHRHPTCSYTTTPKTNTVFWNKKFENNIKRDHRNHEQLMRLGWKVVVIWQCELKDINRLADKLSKAIHGQQ